jgi:hypothetical protein
MTAAPAVLLPVRIETRFKNGDLWLRVVPDEPWFVRDDPRIMPAELDALARFAAAPPDPGAAGAPAAWRDLAGQVGAARAAGLYRSFVTAAPDGTLTVRPPKPDEQRTDPVLPRIVGFPTELVVWLSDASGVHDVAHLHVDTTRLLADFADPDQPGDRRWWADWGEAVAVGVAAVVPASSISEPIDALYVTGLADTSPDELFAALAAEGRLGLLDPGLATNSVDGAHAAPLGNDPQTWWDALHAAPGVADADVSRALTADPALLGHLPGGDRDFRRPSSALVAGLWPALWGFTAAQVFDVTRDPAPARWAAGTLFPEGAYPVLRIGPQPYGLLTTTAWSHWVADPADPPVEAVLVPALVTLRGQHADAAQRRGTSVGVDTDALLDLLADTPRSARYGYRVAWPLELWWLATVASGLQIDWRLFARAWRSRHPLVGQLGLDPLRPYGARGAARRLPLPLVLPDGVSEADLADLIERLVEAAHEMPAVFATTEAVDSQVLQGRGHSLLLRLAMRSLQLAIGDLRRLARFDPEPISRIQAAPGRLQSLVAMADPADVAGHSPAAGQLRDVAAALSALAAVPVPELDRRLRATIDSSTHRIDSWLVAVPQRRLDGSGAAPRRLGAYGWVDAPQPGSPGPTAAGLLTTPSPSTALAAAVLRDRALSDPSARWQLAITSASARAADRIAVEVRAGAHLFEVLGREVERVVADPAGIAKLRRDFPVRAAHAGRRVCDGLAVLGADPFPVALDAEHEAEIADLRTALDAYGDLLVADAVHHLVEGRADIAGEVMAAAAGLSGPPELSLLRTRRSGRVVSTSAALAIPHVPASPAAADTAQLSPATLLDPSVAAFLAARTGPASGWAATVTRPDGSTATVTLDDVGLLVADALTLSLSQLLRLAGSAGGGLVTGGSLAVRYEQAAALLALVGHAAAGRRTLSETPSQLPPGEAVDDDLAARYAAVHAAGTALVEDLDQAVAAADPGRLAALLTAAARWGVAPDPPDGASDPIVLGRAAEAQLRARLAVAPDPAGATGQSRPALLDAAVALVSPTGQVGVTGTIDAADIPPLTVAPGLDEEWLTVAAAVRPRLAVLEAQQLGSAPFAAWANRPTDPWQTDPHDAHPLVAVYADASLDLSPPAAVLAVVSLDRFDEVVPDAQQATGAAFGFNAPKARAQQAVLLAVPPDSAVELDHPTLVAVLAETRELAHARMARPVDLDDEFWGLAPTGVVPATGAVSLFPGLVE